MALDSSLRPPVTPVIPGAYSAVDASALTSANPLGLPILCVLGATTGGTPNQMLLFRDQQALKNVLRSGAAFDCARFAMAVGVNPVAVVRIGSSILQGSKALAGATSNPVTLTAIDFGAWTNSIQVTVAANNLVTITYTDPNGQVFTETFAGGASATAQNVVDLINGKVPGSPGSQYVAAAVTAGTMPLTTAAISNLTAGSDGSALAGGDWTTGLTAIEGQDVDIVAVATGDATVHAQALTHCQNMSTSAARRERTTVVGAVLGESVGQQVTRMVTLRDKRVQLAYPGTVDFTAAGVLQTWDPFYTAAKVAAMHIIQPDPATSLLHQKVPMVDIESVLSTAPGGAVETLLRAGVSPVVPVPGTQQGFWMADSLSGWNVDDSFRDFHKSRAADAVSIRARTLLEAQFLGKKSLDGTANDLTVAATAVLSQLKNETIIRDYKTPTVQQGGQSNAWNVTLPVLLPDAVKFIFLTIALQPSTAINREVPASDAALV